MAWVVWHNVMVPIRTLQDLRTADPCKVVRKDKQKIKVIKNLFTRAFSWAGQVRVSECDSGSTLILHTSRTGWTTSWHCYLHLF
jgi:hypothetical protein